MRGLVLFVAGILVWIGRPDDDGAERRVRVSS